MNTNILTKKDFEEIDYTDIKQILGSKITSLATRESGWIIDNDETKIYVNFKTKAKEGSIGVKYENLLALIEADESVTKTISKISDSLIKAVAKAEKMIEARKHSGRTATEVFQEYKQLKLKKDKLDFLANLNRQEWSKFRTMLKNKDPKTLEKVLVLKETLKKNEKTKKKEIS